MVSSVVSANGFGDFNVWPPGFRFHPTDEELVLYYLKRKICHKKLKLNIIAETDVYKWEPEELPGLSILKTGDRQWFFFSPRDRKYPNGARSNRGTKHGYWKATGKDRTIVCNSRNVGVKKTLVFYKGRAPNGERTDWIMHEYTLDEEELKRCQNVKEYYALYKVYKKSGPGPKNGEQYGALFREEDWADDECPDFNCPVTDGQVKIINGVDGNTKLSCEVQSSLKLIEEFMNQIAEEPMLDLTPMSNDAYNVSQVLSEKEAQSTLVNSSSKEIVISEPLNWSWSEQCNEQSNFGLTHSALSPLQSLEGPKVTSSPNVNEREAQISQSHVPSEEDFLEIDDLIGPEPTLENMDKTLNSLQYEDGLSELDFFHDAFMFLQDIGPIDRAEISQPYVNSPEQNVANQLCYHTQYNQDDACLVNDIPYSEVGDTINNQPYPLAANEVNNQLYLGGEAQINSQLYSGGAAQINSQLYSGGAAQINSQFYTQTANQVNSQFYSGGTDQINSQLYPQTANVVNLQSYSGGAAQINSHLYLQSTNEVNSQLYSNCAAQINNQHSLDFQEWNGFNSAGFDHDSSYNTTSGVVCDVPNLQTGLNENQSRSNGSGSPSRLSSALWVFLETIPTTPASAATESAFVNRALERLSSFSRAKVNARNINNINIAAVTNAETTKRKAGRKRRGFFFFPVLVAVCAILWVIIGTVRQWGISISF